MMVEPKKPIFGLGLGHSQDLKVTRSQMKMDSEYEDNCNHFFSCAKIGTLPQFGAHKKIQR